MQLQDIRHGDIILRSVKSLPPGGKRIPVSDSYIVAEGESTGHKHVLEVLSKPGPMEEKLEAANISPAIEVYEIGGLRFLTVTEDCRITHQEHKTVIVPPGIYRIDIQEERDPFLDNIRQMAD